MKISFNRPFIVGKELYYMAQSVLGGHISGDGPFTKKCQTLMEEKFNAKKILLTHSCTAALEMAAILCEVGPGDEVILPSFTFVSTANAFYIRGTKISTRRILGWRYSARTRMKGARTTSGPLALRSTTRGPARSSGQRPTGWMSAAA